MHEREFRKPMCSFSETTTLTEITGGSEQPLDTDQDTKNDNISESEVNPIRAHPVGICIDDQ